MSEKNQTMGAKVAENVCTICGEENSPCEHRKVYKYGQDAGPTLLSFGLVPAPRCDGCDESMVYTGHGTDWACPTADCPQEGVSVPTGIGGILREG